MKKFITYYFFSLLATFLILSSGVIDSQDGFQYLAVARNIYYKGEPTAPEYGYNIRENIHMSTYVAGDGKTYSPTGLGYSLAYLPAVAITDMVYKIYNISPPVHFPLENDWLILLTASFTNGFFAAVLGVTIFLYLLELGLSKKQALLISFAGLFTTNLLPYAKYSFPHMMFTAFLVLAFFLIKKYFQTKKKLFLIFAGASFGMVSITYNQTFLLAVIPLGIYILILSKLRLIFTSPKKFIGSLKIKFLLSNLLIFFLGTLPLLIIYLWFENLRSGTTQNLANPLNIAGRGVAPFLDIPKPVFFEGIYGQLFSPGRSIFLYSPILLVTIFFWHRIKKVIYPETLVFLILSIITIIFFASQRTFDAQRGVAAIWHGESSWGPRYLSPLIPFGILIVSWIFVKLSKPQKLFIFFPLLLIGFYINMLGILMPYQIKYHDLQEKFYVNSTEFTNFTYSNFIPRYSPVIMLSRELVKLFQALPQIIDHGLYNVRFHDGIDFPFLVGNERWRVIERKGDILFDDRTRFPVKKISLGLINHPIEEASNSAIIKVSLNDNVILESEKFLPAERKLIDLNIPGNLLKNKDNWLTVSFETISPMSQSSELNQYRDDPSKYENKNTQPKKYVPQIFSLISFAIDGNDVNKETFDFPYVSSLGPAMMGVKYNTYGESITDPWRFWEMHTQVYERTPDFWWFKYLIYWDIPKLPLLILLASLILCLIYSGFKTYRFLKDD